MVLKPTWRRWDPDEYESRRRLEALLDRVLPGRERRRRDAARYVASHLTGMTDEQADWDESAGDE